MLVYQEEERQTENNNVHEVSFNTEKETLCMPTILVLLGWHLFFYANEGNEPIHIHCRKANMECKYWIDEDNFDIQEEYSYGMSPKDKKQIRKIIFEHFDYIVEQWNEFQERRYL